MTMIENTTWTLSQRLKRARLLAGLDQAEIAAELRVSRPTVSDWERGKTEPSATNFVRWAQITGQPLAFLADGVNAQTASAEAEAVEMVHPPGLEPGTH